MTAQYYQYELQFYPEIARYGPQFMAEGFVWDDVLAGAIEKAREDGDPGMQRMARLVGRILAGELEQHLERKIRESANKPGKSILKNIGCWINAALVLFGKKKQ